MVALASATCEDVEQLVGDEIIDAMDKYVKMTVRSRFEAQDRHFIYEKELIMDKKFDKKIDGAIAYYVVHNIKGSENDPNYKHVYNEVINEKTGKRDLTKKHVEDILENVLGKKCRAYVAAAKGALSHASEDNTCYAEMNFRVHLCEMLEKKKSKIAKGMFERASESVLVE